MLVEHGLPDLVEDVQLVATELATNAILHARTSFTLTLSCGDGRVVVRVSDTSPRAVVHTRAGLLDTGSREADLAGPHDAGQMDTDLLHTDLLDEGLLATVGRGLTIVSRLSHRWGVTPGPAGSKSVWATFETAPDVLPTTW
jgi:hypothetical protein